MRTAWLPLARRLAKELNAPLADVVPDDDIPTDLVLHYGTPPQPAPWLRRRRKIPTR